MPRAKPLDIVDFVDHRDHRRFADRSTPMRDDSSFADHRDLWRLAASDPQGSMVSYKAASGVTWRPCRRGSSGRQKQRYAHAALCGVGTQGLKAPMRDGADSASHRDRWRLPAFEQQGS